MNDAIRRYLTHRQLDRCFSATASRGLRSLFLSLSLSLSLERDRDDDGTLGNLRKRGRVETIKRGEFSSKLV